MRKHWPWIVLLLIPLIPLWRTVFLGEAIGPFEQIQPMMRAHNPKPEQAWDVLQADGVLQFYVWRDLVFEAWGKGNLPFWNPYELAGTPLLANSQSGALYPPHILMGVLHIPTPLAITLLAWFHLFWAGLGMSRLVRALGGSQAGGVLAGASFALSPFMLSWTALSSVITTVCWIPWILALAVETYRNEKKPWLGLSICIGMMVLGGHLQFVAYGFMALVFLAIVEIAKAKSQWLKPSLQILLAGILGICIAAPQLLAVLNYSQFSHRKNAPTDEGYAAYSASTLTGIELVGLVYPKLAGDPTQTVLNNEWGGLSAYWPEYFKRGSNFAESALGIGPIVLLLLFALKRRQWSNPMTAIGALGLSLALGVGINRLLYFYAPGWSSTGSPGRGIVLFVLACCALAGLAIPEKGEEDPPKSKLKLYAPVIALALFTVATLKWARMAPEMVQSDYAGQLPPELPTSIGTAAVTAAAPIALVSFLIAAIFAVAVLSGRVKHPPAWLIPAVLIAAIQLNGLVRTAPPIGSYNQGSFERYAFVNNDWEIFAAVPALYPPNTGALSRSHEIAGYDSLLHRDSKKLLDDINGQDSAPPANGNMMFIKPTFDPKKLAAAGVTKVWSRKELPQLGQPTPHGDFFEYQLDGPGRVSVDDKPAKVVSETSNQIQVEAEGPGKLVLRDRNMPGWSAKVDGKDTAISGDPWIELDLSPGKHQIQYTYTAPGFRNGLSLAGLAWLSIVAVWALGSRKNRTAQT